MRTKQTMKEIYDDYQYELLKASIYLEGADVLAGPMDGRAFVRRLRKIERLETLVDLFATLRAHRENNAV